MELLNLNSKQPFKKKIYLEFNDDLDNKIIIIIQYVK